MITKMELISSCYMAKYSCQKSAKILVSKTIFNIKNHLNLSKKIFFEKYQCRSTFLFKLILCSIKTEQLLFLKFLKNFAFFDSYFWPFNKYHEKIITIFVISESWLQSEMFLSNSVDMMKNLPPDQIWWK